MLNTEIRISAIGRKDAVIYGDVVCCDKLAHFYWDKDTEGLRIVQRTRFLKREVPPAEEFFVHKDAVTDAIAREVEQFLATEAAARIRPLDELITEAGGSVEQSYQPLAGERTI